MEADLDELLDEYKPAPEDDLANIFESDLVEPEDLDDVRMVSPFETPPVSLAEALASYAHKLEATLKPAAFGRHLEGLNLLAYYAREEGIDQVAQLDAEALRDFLAVWYVRRWAERSVDDVKRLLGTIEKLTAWLDKGRGTSIGAQYKERLLPELKRDLPRVVEAVCVMDEVADERLEDALAQFDDIMEGAAELLDESDEDSVRVRTLSVLEVEGAVVHVAERAPIEDETDEGDDEDAEEVTRVTLPERVSSLLRVGDVIEAEIARGRDGWTVVTLVGVYPEGAV